MKKKLPILLVAVLVLGGGMYKTVLAKPKEKVKPPKVEGTVYILPKEFLINLDGNRYAKLSVGFIMDPEDHSTAPAGGGGHGAPSPPEGYGTMPQEAIVRDLITDVLTNTPADELVDDHGREKIKKEILHAVHKNTDVHADEVLFMDVTIQ